jgi:hypothetical protein
MVVGSSLYKRSQENIYRGGGEIWAHTHIEGETERGGRSENQLVDVLGLQIFSVFRPWVRDHTMQNRHEDSDARADTVLA